MDKMNDNDDGFYPEDQMDFPESQPQPVQNEAPKKKRGKKIKKKKEHDIDITGEVIKFFRRFWATRQTEDIDKANEPDKYVRITLRELFIYIVFLVVVSILSLGMVSSTVFQYQQILYGQFVDPTSSIYQINDIWTYLQGPFIDGFYNNFYETSSSNLPDPTSYILNENRVLGIPRLRQMRVLSNSCSIPNDFKQEIKSCYADWSSSAEDNQPFGPFANGGNFSENSTGWFYQTERQLNGLLSIDYQGLMNKYGGGGYVVNLSNDQNTTQTILQELFDNLWIDRATRAIFLDFTVYNANINLFCQVKIVFELPASGGVYVSFLLRPLKLIRYVSIMDYVVLVCEGIFCFFLFYYTVEEILEIRKNGTGYFNSVWSFVDIIIIAMGIVCVSLNIYRQVSVSNKLNSLLDNDQQFVNFDFLCYAQTQFNQVIAAITFLAWIKVFKYTSFNKTMTQLSMTLSRCAKDVAGFAVMFFIVFLAYAQLGYLIFGTQVAGFNTVQDSIYTLFRVILGDFDFESLEAANRILGPLYFLTYVFFVFFVLLNMFIAIINDTYGEVKEELSNQKSEIELASFFKKGYNKVLDKLNLKKAQIVDIQKAITTADINNDKRVDFIEWRNSLRAKGYADIEIETLFAKYDLDGDRVLNEEEQQNMMKDLAEQNEELKEAYAILENEKAEGGEEGEEGETVVKKKIKLEGVSFEDYNLLSSRIDKMETSISSITNKIDVVLDKLEDAEKAKKSQPSSQTQLQSQAQLRLGSATSQAKASKTELPRSAKSLKNDF